MMFKYFIVIFDMYHVHVSCLLRQLRRSIDFNVTMRSQLGMSLSLFRDGNRKQTSGFGSFI